MNADHDPLFDADLLQLENELRSLRPVAPGRDFSRRLSAAMEESQTVHPAVVRAFPTIAAAAPRGHVSPFRRYAPVAAAAAVAAVAVPTALSILSSRNSSGSMADAQSRPTTAQGKKRGPTFSYGMPSETWTGATASDYGGSAVQDAASPGFSRSLQPTQVRPPAVEAHNGRYYRMVPDIRMQEYQVTDPLTGQIIIRQEPVEVLVPVLVESM